MNNLRKIAINLQKLNVKDMSALIGAVTDWEDDDYVDEFKKSKIFSYDPRNLSEEQLNDFIFEQIKYAMKTAQNLTTRIENWETDDEESDENDENDEESDEDDEESENDEESEQKPKKRDTKNTPKK